MPFNDGVLLFVETFVYFLCTVANNALDAFVFVHCPHFKTIDVFLISIVDYILASALWKRLGHFAIRLTFICYIFTFVFLRLKRWGMLNKSSGTQAMETEHFSGRYGVRKYILHQCVLYHIHVFFVHALLFCKFLLKQQCCVTSCCICGLSLDISCNVNITRGAWALFSASKGHNLSWGRYVFFFFHKWCVDWPVDIFLWLFYFLLYHNVLNNWKHLCFSWIQELKRFTRF